MKKLGILSLLLLAVSANAQVFLGGSGNLNGGTNIFAGYQINNWAMIGNYYCQDIISIDILYQGFVISRGVNLKDDQNKEFLTLLYAPKIFNFDKKWKIFGKIGIDVSGAINKMNYQKTRSIFGIGLRWN